MSMTRYKGDNVTEILWDKMQHKLGCCGVLSIDDWQNITWSEDQSCVAPSSCKTTRLVANDSFNATTSNATNSTITAEECLADMTAPHHSEVNTDVKSYGQKLIIDVLGLPAPTERGDAQVYQYYWGHHGVCMGHCRKYTRMIILHYTFSLFRLSMFSFPLLSVLSWTMQSTRTSRCGT